jgi:DNA replication protein DnaC
VEQSVSTLETANVAALPDASRRCAGVRTFGGYPHIDCDATLDETRALKCPSCDAETERRQAADEARRSNDGQAQQLRLAGLSQPFISGAKSLKTIQLLTHEHGQAVNAIREWLCWTSGYGNRFGILLRGDLGIGKSDLCEAAIAEAVRRNRAAKYVNARALVLKLQTAFRDDAPESAEMIIERYVRRESALFLAIDDLGATKPTRFSADCLYTLLERRARDQMPTIIATNYKSLADLAERLKASDGDDLDVIRPVDRIEELTPRVITIRGSSLRSTISRATDQC